MHLFAEPYPLGVFRFAAKHNFPLLAAHAIRKFALSEELYHVRVNDIDFTMFDGIPHTYFGPLVRNMTLYQTADGRTDWETVSHNFPKPHCLSTLGAGPPLTLA